MQRARAATTLVTVPAGPAPRETRAPKLLERLRRVLEEMGGCEGVGRDD